MDTDGEDARKIFLIVGAGIFGASAALHIKRAKPWATVILLDQTDFPNQAGASYDHNKIIRSDYRDIFYMKLALQAMEAWRNDPLFKPFYHETGMMFAENAGKGVDWLLNYGLLGHETGATLMEVEEARELFPWFKNANWHGVKQAYYNPRDGWGNAVQALHAVLKAAIDLGVVYQKAVVERLYLEYRQGDPTCVGVHTSQGLLQADHILLCTGAATAKLMADSAPNDSSMQVSGRLVAAAALSCMVRVLPEKRHIYKGAPVFANLMNHTSGEAIPMTPDGYIKLNHELTFTNREIHRLSGQEFSNPPSNSNHCQWTRDVPQVLKDEALKVLLNIYGRADGLEPEYYRLCWDAITPTQDWIISPYGTCENLSIATGGSFHAWKFFPVIGENILAMLDGTLDADKVRKWAWNRLPTVERGACDTYCPRRDLKDIIESERLRARV